MSTDTENNVLHLDDHRKMAVANAGSPPPWALDYTAKPQLKKHRSRRLFDTEFAAHILSHVFMDVRSELMKNERISANSISRIVDRKLDDFIALKARMEMMGK